MVVVLVLVELVVVLDVVELLEVEELVDVDDDDVDVVVQWGKFVESWL